MLIVGLNTSGYVSSAAIVVDGVLEFAAAEERFDRQKFSKHFPKTALSTGLEAVGARLDDVDCFAIGYNPAISIAGRMRPGFSEWPSYPGHRFSSNPNHLLPLLTRTDWQETDQLFLGTGGERAKIRYVAHHIAHGANAFLLSGRSKAAVFTCDGYGERATTTFGIADEKALRTYQQVDFPHSIGSLYATFTQFLGFAPNADEWKVMGAAAYGDPQRYAHDLARLIRWTRGDFEIDLSYFNYFDFDLAPMYRPKLCELLGPPRHAAEELSQRHFDLAAGIQALTEAYLSDALRALHEDTGADAVCMSGGVMMNSVFNGKAACYGPFDHVYVPFAPDDNGNSIGSALWVAWQEGEVAPGQISASPFLGPAYSNEAIAGTLADFRLPYRHCDDIVVATAERLAAGQVVGWFQGRMEFGDRALGGRSILADPRNTSMRDRVNLAVKYRESYRPFAPAILEEAQAAYFPTLRGQPIPYMEKAVPITPKMRARIPAVVHVDGTARLQTVRKDEIPLFHRLISTFRDRTGVPVLLNTSFNVRGEPIVESPRDAIRTFYASGLDALAIGDFLIEKHGEGAGG
jgi:carbamoyltransferase